MIIRPTELKDLHQIVKFPTSREELFFISPSSQYPYTHEQLLKLFHLRKSWVAEIENKTVAYGNFVSIEAQGDVVIGNIMVEPSQRNKGIGTQLLEHMEQHAKHKYDAVTSVVRCFNLNNSALVVYHKLGFTPYSTELKEFIDGKSIVLIDLKRLIS